ncbi:hypothetical protein F0231_00940 [Vibrio sp. RE86]|uniref:hypothetical protein n=1 Tax=Vibrio sp. RE86 TaxID=2607605 RepID=UPI0014933D99|nr:hypothetical protein [Vibrio sp. RE86]NOH78301.1 hypothetical protein [Vibrio sp. RE86]
MKVSSTVEEHSMPRISREERERRKSLYDSAIRKIIIEEGVHVCTYDRLSNEVGVSRSTLQGYYPTQTEFLSAFEGHFLELFSTRFDYSSSAKFIQSFSELLSEPVFNTLVTTSVASLISPDYQGDKVTKIFIRFEKQLKGHFTDQEVDEIFLTLFGSIFLLKIGKYSIT